MILTALFVVQERHAQEPMLPLSLFTNRVFARTTLIGLVVNIPFYGLIFVFSLYFQKINGLSPFATGLAFVPMMGAVLPVNLLAPRLAERFGGPATVAAGAIISAAACVALLGIERGTSYWALCVPLVAMGCGIALSVPPLTSALLGSVERSRSGVAPGVLNSARQTGRANEQFHIRRSCRLSYLYAAARQRRDHDCDRRARKKKCALRYVAASVATVGGSHVGGTL